MTDAQAEGLSVFEVLFDKTKNLDATYAFSYFWKR